MAEILSAFLALSGHCERITMKKILDTSKATNKLGKINKLFLNKDVFVFFNHIAKKIVLQPKFDQICKTLSSKFGVKNDEFRDFIYALNGAYSSITKKDCMLYERIAQKMISFFSEQHIDEYLKHPFDIKSQKPDEPKGGKLDKFAFGEERGLPEDDNNFEANLFYDLEEHFSTAGMPKSSVDAIANFIKTGKYSNIFKAPSVEKVYRGMGIQYEWLKSANSIGKGWVLNNTGKIDKSFTWYPKRNVGSWTKDISVAREFAENNAYGDYVPVILVAYINKNKLGTFFDFKELYKLIPTYDYEKEILSLGKVIVSQIFWSDADLAAKDYKGDYKSKFVNSQKSFTQLNKKYENKKNS